MIDLERERAATPGTRDRVFLDSAGSSLPTSEVTGRVIDHLRRESEVGGYRAAAERSEDLDAVPASIARLLGCSPDEVALTDSATRAWNQFVTALRWQPGDRILICANEYASNAIALLQRARYDGCSVEVVPSAPEGGPDLDAYAALLDERVRLVSLVHVPTNTGRVAPVAEMTALAHDVGALVVLDACQSVGQLAVDVAALGVDALAATGRKWLRAPRGTGFLYVRRPLLESIEPAAADLRGGTWTGPDDYDLRPDARRFELWETDVAGRLGLGAAVHHLLALGADPVEEAVRTGAAELRAGLREIPGVAVHDHGHDLSGIVSITVDGLPAARLRDRFDEAGVTVSVSEVSSTRLDMTERGLEAVVRLSPHYFNSADDRAAAIAVVRAVIGT